MKSPVYLSDLLGNIAQATDTYAPRRDRPYPPDMEASASAMKRDMEIGSSEGSPALFNISIIIPMSEVRAWTDQGYVSFEKTVMARSHDDALRQLQIHVNRK